MIGKQKKRWTERGFTIVELAVVIAVIAVLATITSVSYTKIMAKSRATAHIADLQTFQQALERYKTKNGNYPVSLSWTFQREAPTTFLSVLVPTYAQSLPGLPDGSASSTKNNTYAYRTTASGIDYKIIFLYQPSVSTDEFNEVPARMKESTNVDRYGLWSSGGKAL